MPGDVSQKLGREANQWQVHHGTITRRACIVAVRFEAPALGGRQHVPISRPSPCSLDAGDPDHSTGVHAERSGAAPSVSVGASGSIRTDSELGDEGGYFRDAVKKSCATRACKYLHRVRTQPQLYLPESFERFQGRFLSNVAATE